MRFIIKKAVLSVSMLLILLLIQALSFAEYDSGVLSSDMPETLQEDQAETDAEMDKQSSNTGTSPQLSAEPEEHENLNEDENATEKENDPENMNEENDPEPERSTSYLEEIPFGYERYTLLETKIPEGYRLLKLYVAKNCVDSEQISITDPLIIMGNIKLLLYINGFYVEPTDSVKEGDKISFSANSEDVFALVEVKVQEKPREEIEVDPESENTRGVKGTASVNIPETETDIIRVKVQIPNPAETLESVCVQLENSGLESMTMNEENAWTAIWEIQGSGENLVPQVISAVDRQGEVLHNAWFAGDPVMANRTETAERWTAQTELSEGIYKLLLSDSPGCLLQSSESKQKCAEYGYYYPLLIGSDDVESLSEYAKWSVSLYSSAGYASWRIQNRGSSGILGACRSGKNYYFGAIDADTVSSSFSGNRFSSWYDASYFLQVNNGSVLASAYEYTSVVPYRLEYETRNIQEFLYSLSMQDAVPSTSVRIRLQTEGNIADQTKAFLFHVSFSDGRDAESFRLKHGEEMVIGGIPSGICITVLVDSEDYSVKSYVGEHVFGSEVTADPSQGFDEILFVNGLSGNVEIGIWLDRTPYLLILFGMIPALFIRRKLCYIIKTGGNLQ